MTKAQTMQARYTEQVKAMAKFRVGDLVTDKDDLGRVDRVTKVFGGVYGGVEYYTEEIQAPYRKALRFEPDMRLAQ